MTKEEAIEVYNGLINTKIREAFEFFAPELKESEDEKVCKEIKQFIRSRGMQLAQSKVESWIAWLEKQYEHARFREVIQVGDHVTKNEDGVLVNLSQLKRVAKKDEKQGKQSNANKEYWRGYREGKQEVLDKYSEFEKQGEQKPAGCLEYCVMSNCANCPYYPVLIKKPAEWSEEDKEILDDIILCGERHCYLDARAVCWLKSLKDKVQPKQEWKQENIGDLTDFENVMMHIGNSFFGENAGLDPNDTNVIKEQANLLLELVPKQEWNEETSMMIDNILGTYKTLEDMLDLTTSQDRDILESMNFERDWIKSLKYRIQPKQEWSEEDERNLNDAILFIETGTYSLDKDNLINWLKSLRPQNR